MVYREFIAGKTLPRISPVTFGYEIGHSPHSYGPAIRTHWLLHYVLSGCGEFRKNGRRYRVAAREIFVIRPYEETVYSPDPAQPWDYIWVGFTALGELPKALSEAVVSCPAAGRIFEEMKRCSGLEEGKNYHLSARLMELFSCLEENDARPPDLIDQALDYMHAEYMHELSVQDIAARLGFDRCYFSKRFRQKTGLPPGKYLSRLRLEKAAELMAVHGFSPSVATVSCGYQNLYHFSKMFKAHFGRSPRQWLEQQRLSKARR